MNVGQAVFAQLNEQIPGKEFQKCVARYRGGYYLKSLSWWDQFLAMAFAQLTYRKGLRDIEASLCAMGGKLYHMGFRSKVARSTLADANELRDWRIFADYVLRLGPRPEGGTPEISTGSVRRSDRITPRKRRSRQQQRNVGRTLASIECPAVRFQTVPDT